MSWLVATTVRLVQKGLSQHEDQPATPPVATKTCTVQTVPKTVESRGYISHPPQEALATDDPSPLPTDVLHRQATAPDYTNIIRSPMVQSRAEAERRSRGDPPLGHVSDILAGKDFIVSFEGTSQFTARGVSACGLAAFNFARIAFRIEQSKRTMKDVVNQLGSRQIIEEIVAICARWSNDLHLEVDDLYRLPIFEKSLRLMSIEYTSPRPKQFMKLLDILRNIEKSAVVIITRPPEIIACFKFANANSSPNTSPQPLFVIFDSHPRVSHPHGAGLSFSTSAESTARTLSEILPAADESLLDSLDFQWQAQLLANCSGHVFVAKDQLDSPEDSVIQSSLAILSLRAKVAELDRQNRTLGSDNKRLELEVDRLNDAIRQERSQAGLLQASIQSVSRLQGHGRSFGRISHATPGPSRSNIGINDAQAYWAHPFRLSLPAQIYSTVNGPSRPSEHGPNDTQKNAYHSSGSQQADGSAHSIFADNPPPVPARNTYNYENSNWEMDVTMDLDDLSINPFEIARQLQLEYDLEDRRLRQEHLNLVAHLQATFMCAICLEEEPEDNLASVDGCTHSMCRSCLRGFACSKIQEHRFPILCPVCTAANDRDPASISRSLIEQLGITEEHSQILTEMELAEFTIQIHCRTCKRAAFVDRQDYAQVSTIVCPQVDCAHMWCKRCEQSIVFGGPTHSCDGSSELEHLMKSKGWKHCPNCTTPILKESGCNHMTCISPGCNTHFCYVCGGMIVRSALRNEVANATAAHYRVCQLFEVPD